MSYAFALSSQRYAIGYESDDPARVAFFAQRHGEEVKPDERQVCSICGKPVPEERKTISIKARTCSAKCGRLHRNNVINEWKRANFPPRQRAVKQVSPKAPKHCVDCDVDLTGTRPQTIRCKEHYAIHHRAANREHKRKQRLKLKEAA